MQKFIVTQYDQLRYGDVNLHKDLLRDGEHCIGGGFYEIDPVNMRFNMYGRSYDFGRVKWDRVDTLILPASLRGLDVYYEDIPLGDFVAFRFA